MKLLKTMAAGLGLLAAASLVPAASPAAAQQSRTFDLQHGFPINLPSLGPSPGRWAQMVDAMTNGEIKIRVRNAGELSPPLEMFGAVSSGAIPMAFDWMGYWANQIPVTNLVSAMPFGASPEILLAWMFRGGGLEIIQKAYDPHNVVILPCHLVDSEAGGWFRKEINSVDDLKGLRMRIAGLGALVLSKLGVSTQLVPAGEIFVALERGRIDATEFSLPSIDRGLGFYRVAKNYYFPGWHQLATWDSIIINKSVWNSFTDRQRTIMREACMANVTFNMYDQIDTQRTALEYYRTQGVTIRRFPDTVLTALQKASEEVLNEQAARDPLFKEALASLRDYIAKVGEWRELQRIPAPQR